MMVRIFLKEKTLTGYLNRILRMSAMQQHQVCFDIIGHCDLIRIYGFYPSSDPEPFYRNLAKVMKTSNVAFEVNTNGRNRPLSDFYPDRKFLHIFREEGVPVCVNSDAHMPVRVAQYFNEAYDLLRSAGFKEMAVFERRQRSMIPF